MKSAKTAIQILSLVMVMLLAGQTVPQAAGLQSNPGMVIILDNSGSMDAALGSSTRLNAAKAQLNAISGTLRPFGTAFQTFNGCSVVSNFGFNQANPGEAIRSVLPGIFASGSTPIAQSLLAAGSSFASAGFDEQTILYIGDGDETCGGNPAQVIKDLDEQGINVTVFAVGIDLDTDARETLLAVAQASGGKLFEASSPDEVQDAIQRAFNEATNSPPRVGLINVKVNVNNSTAPVPVAVDIKVNNNFVGQITPGGSLQIFDTVGTTLQVRAEDSSGCYAFVIGGNFASGNATVSITIEATAKVLQLQMEKIGGSSCP